MSVYTCGCVTSREVFDARVVLGTIQGGVGNTELVDSVPEFRKLIVHFGRKS